jgi:opacity protein-like surface antigen
LTFAFLFLVEIGASAQENLSVPKSSEVSIGNTSIYREGAEIVVDYEVLFGSAVKSCGVRVDLFADGNRLYNLSSSKYLKGDWRKIRNSGVKQLRYDVSGVKNLLADKELNFKLTVCRKNVLKHQFLLMASLGPDFGAESVSAGLMFGYVKKCGGYVKVRTNFLSNKYSYVYTDGDDTAIWATGNYRTSRLHATAGGMFRFARWLYPYVGVGYGYRNVYWEDVNGDWARIDDCAIDFQPNVRSITGAVAADFGAVIKMGHVAVSAGLSVLFPNYCEFEVGIGWAF